MQDLVNVKTPRPSQFLFEGCYRRYATALKKIFKWHDGSWSL